MTTLPRSLAARLALALLFAAGAVVLLDRWVLLGDRLAEAQAAAATVRSIEPAPVVRVQPVPGEILLAMRFEAVPADAAPVVQVFADGVAAVRRPLPFADRPDRRPPPTPAILLPDARLPRLDARARATLVDLVAQLAAERPVRVARFRALDFALGAAEFERLLRWVP